MAGNASYGSLALVAGKGTSRLVLCPHVVFTWSLAYIMCAYPVAFLGCFAASADECAREAFASTTMTLRGLRPCAWILIHASHEISMPTLAQG